MSQLQVSMKPAGASHPHPRDTATTARLVTRLAASSSQIHCAGEQASVSELLRWGQAYWQGIPEAQCCGLSQLTTLQHIALLITALVQQRCLVLAAGAGQLPDFCCPLDPAKAPAPQQGAGAEHRDISDSAALTGHFAVLSSGTLGSPKLIWHNPPNALACAELVRQRLGLASGERVLISVPLHHMYGLGAALLPALLAGAEVHLLPQANVLSLLQALKDEPHWIYTTPHQLRTVAGRLRRPQNRCRGLILAGDAISEALIQQATANFPQIFNLYGSSELGVIAIANANQIHQLVALPGVHLSGPSPDGTPAPLSVSHPYPAARIDQHGHSQALNSPWPTADLASCNAHAHWQIHGRADFSLNRAGKLLILAELEQQVMSWPGVALAVALALDEDTAIGKAIALWVEASPQGQQHGELNETSLRRLAQQHLPAFARPEYYRCVAQLPCLASGKPDRRAIARESHHGSSTHHHPAEKHSERRLGPESERSRDRRSRFFV